MSGKPEKSGIFASILHKTITASNAHVRGCEEEIVNKLNDLVQDLTKHIKEDRDINRLFTEENRLASDCLISLLSVISDCDHFLQSNILDLVTQIGSEQCSGVLLYNLGFMDVLVSLLEEQSSSLQVMSAMARITKHVKFTGREDFMDSLLQHVIANVMSNDVSLKPSLCILVNLASECLPIQMQIRSLDRSCMLRKSFIRLVSHDDNEISVVALAAMTSTGMSEEFNKLINSDKNLDQILKLSFSIILGLTTSEAFGYVIDVLVHLIKNKRVQHFLVNSCPQLDSFVSKSACLLTRCDETQLVKLFELLLELASIPTIRLMLTSQVFAPVRTSADGEEELLQYIFYLAKRSVSVDSGASVSALKLITYIYEGLAIDPSQAGSTCHLNFQFLTECLKQNELDSKRQIVKTLSAEKILASLCLLEVLVMSDAFTSVTLSEIEPATITDVIEYQLQYNPVAFNWNNKVTASEHPVAWSKLGVEIVLRAVSVIIEATERNESYSTCLSDCLQKTSLLPFIATGLSSSVADQVQLSLKLIGKSSSLALLQTSVMQFTSSPMTTPALLLYSLHQTHVLSDVLSSINNKKSHTSSHSPQTPPGYHKCLRSTDVDNKENIILSSPCLSPRSSDKVVLSSQQSSQVDIAERLANLQVSGDSHVSDIISVYEQKLRAQKTRETHLDDLVQAKTMALSQADRLIQQYKSRLAQVDAETHKLRSIVHESERRSEGYRDAMNEMLVDREKLQAEMERLRQDSLKLEDTLRNLATVQRELNALTEIHTTLTNFTDNLKRQHRELESEYSLLKESERRKAASIIEKDTKISEMKKTNKKLDDRIKNLGVEKANLEEKCETLKTENKKLDKTLKQKEQMLKVISDTLK